MENTMKKNKILPVLLIFLFGLAINPGFAENRKLAQTGMKFLVVAPDARSSALSGAVISMDAASTSLFYNPSAMARMKPSFHTSLGQVQWIADINYVYGTAAYKPAQGRYGVFGISFLSVDYGDFLGTIKADNEQGFIDTGVFQPAAYAVGFGYARSLTDKFSIGGHAKYVKQNLTGGIVNFEQDQSLKSKNFNIDVMAFDFGLSYITGFKSLQIGMNIRNFAEEIKYIRESFQLPLTFKMGISMNVMDFFEMEKQSLFLSVDYLHPRDFQEQINIGLEYVLWNSVALRTGFTSPTDEQSVSFGAGFRQDILDYNLGIDYAFTSFGIFDDVHRFSFQFAF